MTTEQEQLMRCVDCLTGMAMSVISERLDHPLLCLWTKGHGLELPLADVAKGLRFDLAEARRISETKGRVRRLLLPAPQTRVEATWVRGKMERRGELLAEDVGEVVNHAGLWCLLIEHANRARAAALLN